jgi:N utilization substance protein B
MNKKRAAREFCFQYFFHLQLPVFEEIRRAMVQEQNPQELTDSINEFKETTNSLFEDDLNAYVVNTISGTLKNYNEIQDVIERNLKNWKLNRLSKVDHTNLLLSTYELCFDKETPVNIVINEAIEISKKFGSLESGSFINGLLDAIAKNEVTAK